MRYAKEHKQATRKQILVGARRLFAAQGFAATSIDAVMQECGLTRGGFYAHFKSKGELYREVMNELGAESEEAVTAQPTARVDEQGIMGVDWIEVLFSQAMHLDEEPSQFTFLATDVGNDDPDVRSAYAVAVLAMSERIRANAQARTKTAAVKEDVVLALTAMMIGAAAISQTIDDAGLKAQLLVACRDTARRIADDANAPQALLWEGMLLGSLQRRLQLAGNL